jgi:hypothetical protein
VHHRIPRCLGVPMLLLAALMGGGCTAGPSDRPAVAVRDANLPPQRFQQALPSTPPLPPVGDYYRNSLPWRDCTDAISGALGMASPRPVESATLCIWTSPGSATARHPLS